ncbi:MAG: arginine--tRNA ligase [bacterium]|nr:arginine--tRNA ligase [bacterium]
MSIIKSVEKDIKELIKSAGYEIDRFILQPSNRKELGDYQINDAMSLAKIYHESPIIIAGKIKDVLESDSRFTNINIAGPGFINLSFSDEFLINLVNSMEDDILNNIDMQEHKKIMLDYGGANVAKALHVGHLRSANLGEALKRLAKLLGQEVISDAHLGDYGRPLGLVVLELKERYPDLAFFDEAYQGDYTLVDLPITNSDLEKIYPEASTKAKEDEEYLEEARIITTKIQNHERGYYDIWKKVVDISKKEIKQVYDNLNVSYDLWEGESDAAEYVPELLEIMNSKNLVKLSDNAKIVEVKEEDETSPMPPLLLVKSNGSISYETTDLATILERKKKFNPDEIWYCADLRQQLHFEQVFRASRKAELVDSNVKLEYIGFGTMNGLDGKPFKTRDGGVMSLKALMDLIKEETKKRINYDIVKEDKLDETINIISMATLKYADFLPFRGTDYIFNPAKFADVEGKTGPYILYSTIRMKSLLEKGKEEKKETYSKIGNQTDREILLTLLKLPITLTKAYEAKSLNDIAEYLYTLTSKYNTFYADNKILLEEDALLKESWLVLTDIVYKTNLLLLDTLGLKVPEKM